MPAAEPSIDGMIRAETKQQLSELKPPTDIHHPILGMAPSVLSALAKPMSGQLHLGSVLAVKAALHFLFQVCPLYHWALCAAVMHEGAVVCPASLVKAATLAQQPNTHAMSHPGYDLPL